MPIFRVKSVKIYTGQKKFPRAQLVALVTNIRYAQWCGNGSKVAQEGLRILRNTNLDIP